MMQMSEVDMLAPSALGFFENHRSLVAVSSSFKLSSFGIDISKFADLSSCGMMSSCEDTVLQEESTHLHWSYASLDGEALRESIINCELGQTLA